MPTCAPSIVNSASPHAMPRPSLPSSSRSHCSLVHGSSRELTGEYGPTCCLFSQFYQEERNIIMNNTQPASFTHGSAGERYVVAAERVFDGTRVLERHAVAVAGDRIEAVTPIDRLRGPGQLIHFAGTSFPASSTCTPICCS